MARIEQLENLVSTLAKRLDDVESALSNRSEATHFPDASSKQSIAIALDDETESSNAPLFVLRDAATQSGFRAADDTATDTSARNLSDDIILKGLLNELEAMSLLSLFRENYGRWVAFDPAIPTPRLLEDVRKSPLLLVACCLIAVRNTSVAQASRLAPKLFKVAKALLSTAMLSVPQPIEFFQSSLVLSLWSTTIGQIPLNVDGWLLSGFALQHSVRVVREKFHCASRFIAFWPSWVCLVGLH